MPAQTVIERELRVRARHASTFWLRVAVGAASGLVVLMLSSVLGLRVGTRSVGKPVFEAIRFLALAFCLLEGVRQTADALCRERREGTLGLLFLTDLGGWEVVAGKLLAGVLSSGYALLAAFPALGLTLTMGGVTVGEFWRTQLLLLTALPLSAACGLWISSRSEDDVRALLGAFGTISLLAILPLGGLRFAEDLAFRTNPWPFFGFTTAVVLAAVGMLFRASRNLGQTWRLPLTLPARQRSAKPATSSGWHYRPAPSLHARPLPPGPPSAPAEWLAGRQRGIAMLIWLGVLLPIVPQGIQLLFSRFLGLRIFGSTFSYVGFFGLSSIISLLSDLLLAYAASRGLAEARRSGTLELLLSTPLSPVALVRAYWLALWRPLRWAVLIRILYWVGLLSQMALGSSGFPLTASYGASLLTGIVSIVLWPIAVCWMALWYGLRLRRQSAAVGMTLVWTVVCRSVAQILWSFVFVRFVLAGNTPNTHLIYLNSLISSALFGLAYPVALAYWARHRLLTRFRQVAATP